MALKTMIENLNKARKAYEGQLAELGKNAQKAVAEFLAPLIPPGYAVKWTQYTPYFNDGDACTFSVHAPYIVSVDDEDSEGFGLAEAVEKYGKPDEERSYERRDWATNKTVTKTYTVHGFPKIDGWTKAKMKQLDDAWDELPEDLLESAFGDHVEAIVRADGTFEVNKYSHD